MIKTELKLRKNPLDGYNILVVDDEPDERTFIATVLEDNGATVSQAENGDEALSMAASLKPDLITLDLAMPVKNGIVVFETLRADPEMSSIPVCIITGRPELRKLIYEQPSSEKPEGYLNKPINEESVLRGVEKILNPLDQRRRGNALCPVDTNGHT
jgi:twitching motility two-component system response regulator PilH